MNTIIYMSRGGTSLNIETHSTHTLPGPVFSYKLRYIVGHGLVQMAISTNPEPTIYRNVYENGAPEELVSVTQHSGHIHHHPGDFHAIHQAPG